MSDEGYRDQAMPQTERIERLEKAVAGFSVRRLYEAIRWGLIVLLAGIGIGAGLYGASFIRAHLVEEQRVREEVRSNARRQCARACESAGMSVGRTRLAADSDHRVAQCSCLSPHSRRVLWDDTQRFHQPSYEEVLRGQCAEACAEAGMGLNRAVISGSRVIACGCVNERSHRTLWDDRPSE